METKEKKHRKSLLMRAAETAKAQKKENEKKEGIMHRYLTESSIQRMEGTGNERKFTLSFSSEEPYNRCWGTEILSHADGDVDLLRLNSIGVVLFNHDRNNVIGKILQAWIDNGRGCAEIEFDSDSAAEVIYQKVLGGTLKGVSVGYLVSVWETVAANQKSGDGRFTGPCDIAKRWTPFEISIVSVPADPTVGVGRSDGETAGHTGVLQEKGVGSFYYDEKQLQINKNILSGGKKLWV